MSKPLPSLFLVGLIALIFFLLWALTIASIVWDTRRRKRTDLERYGWVVLALILPLVGGLAYWTIRLVAHTFSSVPPQMVVENQRFTQLMPVAAPPAVNPTLAGLEPVGRRGMAAANPDEISTFNPPPKGSWCLSLVEGPEQGKQFELASLPQMIGRSTAASILLGGDAKISRRHAEIYDRQGVLYIRDLGSLHGTQVNGVSIQDQNLENGDRIQIGGTVLVVQTSDG